MVTDVRQRGALVREHAPAQLEAASICEAKSPICVPGLPSLSWSLSGPGARSAVSRAKPWDNPSDELLLKHATLSRGVATLVRVLALGLCISTFVSAEVPLPRQILPGVS
eukprot:CAMPEP_0179289764 /NCGR_PEP_ID=MMETSP0797-20121207/41467_1 /TAXON_ID=47934 /ORGANISM="Dinophysis acuminata, Strain DAEP01" /LENGTH=109 /DNA_ID=CAMNT_0020998773 /DNA_START=339 /DNA_END=665 /DNA_ORIENTATION=-